MLVPIEAFVAEMARMAHKVIARFSMKEVRVAPPSTLSSGSPSYSSSSEEHHHKKSTKRSRKS